VPNWQYLCSFTGLHFAFLPACVFSSLTGSNGFANFKASLNRRAATACSCLLLK
jgi:hypothetical protein